MNPSGQSLPLILGLGFLSACATATQRGQALYVEGRLIEAAEVFEHGEDNIAELGGAERVRYGLYRGATLLRLGDLTGAARWLHFAQQAENGSPGLIERSDEQTLRLAFKDLDRRRALATLAIDPWTGVVAHASSGTGTRGPDVVDLVESSPSAATSASLPNPHAAPLTRP